MIRSKNKLSALVVGAVLLIVIMTILSCGKYEDDSKKIEFQPTLRVAWMTVWATAGQVVESLIHTDITKETGLNVEFKSFLFGPTMNEAAITGDVDVTVVGDMPAIILLAKSDKWSVVSRTLYFPYGLMVRSNVSATSIADLRSKIIGVPFGSGPQPTLYRWLDEAGLEIGKDVTVINLLPNEIGEAIKAKRVDAVMTWEPTMTILEQGGDARVLKDAKGVGFMCMSNEFIKKHPKQVIAYVESWKRGLLYVAKNSKQADEWFAVDSKYPLDLLAKIRVIDPNLSATNLSDINVNLTEEDIAINQRKADFAFEQGLIQSKIAISNRIVRLADLKSD